MNSPLNPTNIRSAMAPSKMATPKVTEIINMLQSKDAYSRLEKMMGPKAPLFVQTVRNVLLMPDNRKLLYCSPESILRSCMASAVSGLTIDPAFGQAAIVPFKDGAVFMPMKKGLVHLAMNTGIIQRLNAAPVYDGDIKSFNPFTGDYEYNEEEHPRENIIGYMAYLRFLNGADHYEYMTIDELKKHGKMYSKSYDIGLWTKNPGVMYEKTVLRKVIINWGKLDTMADSKLWLALKFDMATPSSMDIESAIPIYVDNPGTDVQAIQDAIL